MQSAKLVAEWLLGFGLLVVLVIQLGACGDTGNVGAAKSSASSKTQTEAASGSGSSRAGVLPASLLSGPYKEFKGDQDDEEPRSQSARRDKDSDFDNDIADKRAEGYIDHDDAVIAGFGQPASATDTRAVAALVKRFYAYARAGDGAAACRLEYSIFREAIPEDYGPETGLPYATGKTCAEVMSKVFKHNRRLALARFRVTAVRVKGNHGYALLGSKTQPAGYMNLQRERGIWRVVGLLAGTLP